MNCPSRTDEPPRSDGHNQNPNALSNDLTTNQDLNGLANARSLRRTAALPLQSAGLADDAAAASTSAAGPHVDSTDEGDGRLAGGVAGDRTSVVTVSAPAPATPQLGSSQKKLVRSRVRAVSGLDEGEGGGGEGGGGGGDGRRGGREEEEEERQRGAQNSTNTGHQGIAGLFRRVGKTLMTFYRFVGPGFIVAVSYIDPGNYSTNIAAGASYRFRLLFIVLLSNLFATFLQSLAIKLGTVTGLNLAEACRAFLPRWLNYVLYALAEIAIIATDIAEVIGTAIALNLLQPKIPLVAGCAISIVDVFVILFFCRPADQSRISPASQSGQSPPKSQTHRAMRAFEMLVAALVLAVVVCFCIQLSLVHRSSAASTTTVADVLRGYLPSSAVVQAQGLYQACGILGATVMPHSLYLGSGIVQARLREYDSKRGLLPEVPVHLASDQAARVRDDDDDEDEDEDEDEEETDAENNPPHNGKALTYVYVPSLKAIRHSMKYSIAELAISLFTFALFVNSAILVVAGAALYNNAVAEEADIFSIHDLLSQSIAPAAGTVFALALLFSGLSAGVVCTVAGQMVSEGALNWSVAPWLRRLLTRSISIMPSIIIAGAVGRNGLDTALNATQVALSIVLPFVTAPLLWFTCCNRYMTVQPGDARFMLHDKRRQPPRRMTTALAAGAGRAQIWRRPWLLWRHRDDGAVQEIEGVDPPVKMANSWPVALLGLAIWLIMAAMNVANLVLLKSA